MMANRQKKKRAPFRRLLCTSVHGVALDAVVEDYGEEKASVDEGTTTTSLLKTTETFDELEGLEDLFFFAETNADKPKVGETEKEPREQPPSTELQLIPVIPRNDSLSSSLKKSVTSHHTFPKRWDGDKGDDQPVIFTKGDRKTSFRSAPTVLHSSPSRPPRTKRYGQIPTYITAVSKNSSPLSVADSLTVDVPLDTQSTSSNELIQRVESVRARAESILSEAQSLGDAPSRSPFRRIKSIGSSVKTEPTASSSSHSSNHRTLTLSQKIQRLHETKLKLQRVLDEHDDNSTILTESVYDFARFARRSPQPDCDSVRVPVMRRWDEEDSSRDGPAETTTENEGVLKILSMLEALNGYDLDVANDTLEDVQRLLRSSAR